MTGKGTVPFRATLTVTGKGTVPFRATSRDEPRRAGDGEPDV